MIILAPASTAHIVVVITVGDGIAGAVGAGVDVIDGKGVAAVIGDGVGIIIAGVAVGVGAVGDVVRNVMMAAKVVVVLVVSSGTAIPFTSRPGPSGPSGRSS